jgi:hypothetical protein
LACAVIVRTRGFGLTLRVFEVSLFRRADALKNWRIDEQRPSP